MSEDTAALSLNDSTRKDDKEFLVRCLKGMEPEFNANAAADYILDGLAGYGATEPVMSNLDIVNRALLKAGGHEGCEPTYEEPSNDQPVQNLVNNPPPGCRKFGELSPEEREIYAEIIADFGWAKQPDECAEALRRAQMKLTAYLGVCKDDKELPVVIELVKAAREALCQN